MLDEKQGPSTEHSASKTGIDRVREHLPERTQSLLDKIATVLKGKGRKAALEAIVSDDESAESQPLPDNLRPEAIYAAYRSNQKNEKLPAMPDVKEVKPFSAEKLAHAREQLLHIREQFAKAEKPLVSGFTFETTEDGMVKVEYTTADGIQVQMTVGEFEEDLLSGKLEPKNYVGVKSGLLTVSETGKQFDITKPPFQKQLHNIVMNISETDMLSQITPEDIANVTDKGMRFMNRHGSMDDTISSVAFNADTNTILCSELFTIPDMADVRHEATHGEDALVIDYKALERWIYTQPDNFETKKLELDLNQPLAEMQLTTELTATTAATEAIAEITEGMSNSDQIVQTARIYQALGLRTYVDRRRFHLSIPKASKDDFVFTRLRHITTMPFIPPADRPRFIQKFIGDTLLGVPQSRLDELIKDYGV